MSPSELTVVGQFKDYAPVLELAAERWEELETATGGFPVSRLNRWDDDPAGFWRSLRTLSKPLFPLEDEISRIL